ncbi:MAG TPA: hypothetical protein DCP90_09195 [Clostridiales bacterium]|nr:hypothetical protein [Clostridiales bacterium]
MDKLKRVISYVLVVCMMVVNMSFNAGVVLAAAGIAGAPGVAMTETNLDAAVVTLTLTEETFADATLSAANFTLNNAPAGTTIESVTYTDTTHANVALAFSGIDFDADVTTFTITVAAGELAGGNPLVTGNMTITAVVEPVTPAAPAVTNDDTANTVTGMTTAMEYKLDAAGYVVYEAVAFGLLDFSGDHTLLVRVAAEGINPFGPDTTLTFTTNPAVAALAAINAGTEIFADFATAGVVGADVANKDIYDETILAEKVTKGSSLTLVEVQAIVTTINSGKRYVSTIVGNNILLVGDYAFELDADLDVSNYDLNNFLVAAQTAYVNGDTLRYEVYFSFGGTWYDVVTGEGLGTEMTDLSDINGDGLYEYMNMVQE